MSTVSEPQQPLPASTAGAVATILKIITGLTNERMLTLVIAAIAGFLIYKTMEHQSAREVNAAVREANTLAHCSSEAKLLREYFQEQSRDKMKADEAREQNRMRFEAEERTKDRVTIGLVTVEQMRWRDMLGPILRKLPMGDGDEDVVSLLTKRPGELLRVYRDIPELADKLYTGKRIRVQISAGDYKCKGDSIQWYDAKTDDKPTIVFHCIPPKGCTASLVVTGRCVGAIRDGNGGPHEFTLRVEECQVARQ